MEKLHQLPPSDQRKYRQLEILYEISKTIAKFETVELTFPLLMTFAAEALHFSNAILMENRGGTTTTTIWKNKGVNQEKLNAAIESTKHLFAQLVGLRSEARSTLKRPDTFTLPLAVYGRPTFGVLHLQGWTSVDEKDLAFADTLTNLIAVAVDRYYTEDDVVKLREKYIVDLESERDLREGFVSILTHDLRNPLAAVKITAGLIAHKSENLDEHKKLAMRIVGSVERVDHMIENLLDANRIHAGEKLPLAIEKFDLRDLLKTTLEELSVNYGDRLVLVGEQEVLGYWSRDGLRRVIENLINNAVKYGYPDRPITVSLKPAAQTVQITVHNEGSPIPPEDLAFLFERFKRRKSAQAGGIRGWGLGLTLVRGVAEAHGGTAKVESLNGTTFTIELPNDARPFL